jgi:UDP-2,3-diacylglucosamine hydrolase
MLSALFISDLHISGMSDPKAETLREWLRSLNSANCSHLFFMGDIFDFWISNHQIFVREYRPLLAELNRLRDEGVKLFYFEGNHDLHLEKFWETVMGFEVYTGPVYLPLGPWELRLEHGDEMDPEDRGYLFLRWLLRTPVLTWLAHHLPGAVVREIGEASASTSRSYTTEVKKISEDRARKKIHRHAEKSYAERPFHFMISGHVHVRDHYRLLNGGESWNLGSWLKEPGFLMIDEKQARWRGLEVRSGRIESEAKPDS